MNDRYVYRAESLRSTAARLLRLADELESDHGGLKNIEVPEDQENPTGPAKSDAHNELILSQVMEVYKSRRRRSHYLPAELFGEPGWDLLLDLFAARLQGRLVSVTSACIAADVPPTTALRWIRLMEERGLVERIRHRSDQRVKWIGLTDMAASMMFDHYKEIIKYS